MSQYKQLLRLDTEQQQQLLAEANQLLLSFTPAQRVQWALQHLPDQQILSSSFGIQSAVMLHLVTTERPDIPVVLTDTGYLFPETYQFIDELKERLQLNLKVYRAHLSPAWQEARFGKLWETEAGIKQYNHMNKVEPLQRALKELNVGTWFSGLRRSQSSTRADKNIIEISRGTVKVQPIIEWTNKCLLKHSLAWYFPGGIGPAKTP